MKKIILASLGLLFVFSGCSQKADSIEAVYVSPIKYENYSCKQLSQEIVRVTDRVNIIAGKQDKEATNDQVAMGVGLVLFWPSLFFLAHDDHKDELARLKGEYEAVRSAGVQKKCKWAETVPMK